MTFHFFVWCNRHFAFGSPKQQLHVADEDDHGHNSDSDGDSEEDGEDGEDEEDFAETLAYLQNALGGRRRAQQAPAQHDMQRSRRELTDIANKACGRAFRPGQQLGQDEGVRSNKHGGNERIRHKAAVHSGNIFESLNDAKTKYCLFFEEHGWEALNSAPGVDHSSVKARLLRAASVLFDEGKQHSRRKSKTCASSWTRRTRRPRKCRMCCKKS